MPIQNSGENSEKRRGRPENLTPWKPGQSGNPGGRPKRRPITEALEKVFTPEQCLAVAQALLKQAKKGSISHVQEAANRLEGRVEAADESHGNVSFHVTISAPRPHRPAPIEVAPTTPPAVYFLEPNAEK